jgi:hypothetical protein
MERKIEGIKTLSDFFGIIRWMLFIIGLGCIPISILADETDILFIGLIILAQIVPMLCAEKLFYGLYVIALGAMKQNNLSNNK